MSIKPYSRALVSLNVQCGYMGVLLLLLMLIFKNIVSRKYSTEARWLSFLIPSRQTKSQILWDIFHTAETGRKFNAHKMFRRRPGVVLSLPKCTRSAKKKTTTTKKPRGKLKTDSVREHVFGKVICKSVFSLMCLYRIAFIKFWLYYYKTFVSF